MTSDQEIEDCYTTETGTPTLTLKLATEERMIPWASFIQGRFQSEAGGGRGRIELQFQDALLVIEGRDLAPLWGACQMQDLRWVQSIKPEIADQWAGDCVVTRIQMKAQDEA